MLSIVWHVFHCFGCDVSWVLFLVSSMGLALFLIVVLLRSPGFLLLVLVLVPVALVASLLLPPGFVYCFVYDVGFVLPLVCVLV